MNKSENIEFIFGGSFDPIHRGHENIICSLREKCIAWPIRLLPCAIPALMNRTSASFQNRVNLLKLAIRGISNIIIDERENVRQGTTYTIDSLLEMVKEDCSKRRVLVLGTDSVESLPNWHQCEQLSDYCHIVIINRPGSCPFDPAILMKQLNFQIEHNIIDLKKYTNGRYSSLLVEEKDISSSEVREKLRKGLSVERYVSASIKNHIQKNHLYR